MLCTIDTKKNIKCKMQSEKEMLRIKRKLEM